MNIFQISKKFSTKSMSGAPLNHALQHNSYTNMSKSMYYIATQILVSCDYSRTHNRY